MATAPADLQAQLDAAKSTANTARLIVIAGVVVGVVGLAVGGLALLRRPATATAGRMAAQAGQGDD